MNQLVQAEPLQNPNLGSKFDFSKQKQQNHNKQRTINICRLIQNYSPQLLYLNPQYQIFPSQSQIFSSNFVVRNLIIKRKNTSIRWTGLIDLTQLQKPLRDLIQFGEYFVEVYKNQHLKPKFGQQLNKKAIATFQPQKKINTQQILEQSKKNGSKVLKIDLQNNRFIVELPHFSKYRFNNDYHNHNQNQNHPYKTQNRRSFQQYAQEPRYYSKPNELFNSNKSKVSRLIKFNQETQIQETSNQQEQQEQQQFEQAENKNSFIQNIMQKNNRDAIQEQMQQKQFQSNDRNRLKASHKRLQPISGFSPEESVHQSRKYIPSDSSEKLLQKMNKFNEDAIAFFQKTILSIKPQMISQQNSRQDNFGLDSILVHQFIFDKNTGDSLKSILMLYMMLYRFRKVQFDIQINVQILKRTNPNVDEHIQPLFESKQMFQIVRASRQNHILDNLQEQDAHKYYQSQRHELLLKYFQWLIIKNQSHLKFPSTEPLRSLATNDVELLYNKYIAYDQICQEMKQAKQKYPKSFLEKIKKQDNFGNAIFIANIRQQSFRIAQQGHSQKINYDLLLLNKFDAQQEEMVFSNYHWVIRIATQFFYSVKEDLRPTINIILHQYKDNFQIQAGDQEGNNILSNQFILLYNYFIRSYIDAEHFYKNQIGDNIFSWIFQQDSFIKQNLLAQKEQKDTNKFKELTETICLKLLKQANGQHPEKLFKYFRIVIQAVQKNTLIQNFEDKCQIIRNLFYEKECLAETLGRSFSEMIAYCLKYSGTNLDSFIRKIQDEYNHNYSQRIAAKEISDPLKKIRFLLNIREKYVDRDTKIQILKLMMLDKKHSLLIHWSTKILQKILNVLEEFLQTRQEHIYDLIKQRGVKHSKTNKMRMELQQQQQKQREAQMQMQMVNRSFDNQDFKNSDEGYNKKQIETIIGLTLYLRVILNIQPLNEKTFTCLHQLLVSAPKRYEADELFRLNDDHINYMTKKVLQMIFDEEPQHQWFLKVVIKSKPNNLQNQPEGVKTMYRMLTDLLDSFQLQDKNSLYYRVANEWKNQLKVVQLQERVKTNKIHPKLPQFINNYN